MIIVAGIGIIEYDRPGKLAYFSSLMITAANGVVNNTRGKFIIQ